MAIMTGGHVEKIREFECVHVVFPVDVTLTLPP